MAAREPWHPHEQRALAALILALATCVALSILFAPRKAHGWGEIPAAAQVYKGAVIRSVRFEAGPDAPVAVFAAQLEQESGWNPKARSAVGAEGLGQFMPATARDMGRRRPDMGPALPCNPGWAIRALVAYDLDNLKRVRAANKAEAAAMMLAAYNGGLGWVYRDAALAARLGLDPLVWFGSVETCNAGRTEAAHRENQGYPRAILLQRQPKYRVWGPGINCPGIR